MRHLDTPIRTMAPFQWYGGKGNLAKWIVPHVAGGKVYVEPFAGAASVFWHKSQHPVEVLNDLDGRIVNLFRVLQNREKFNEFSHRIRWTLYSFKEFKKARRVADDASDIDRAWAFFVGQNQGFGGKRESDGNWGRGFVSSRGMATTANSWRGRMKLLRTWHDRLTKVQIDSRCALDCIRYWDSKDTVFYLDPPYIADTRAKGSRNVYAVEQDDSFHNRLVDVVLGCKGRVVLSGYPHVCYNPLDEAGWQRIETQTACHAAGRVRGSGLQGKGAAMDKVPRTEVLWVNRPPAVKDRQQGLFP